MASFQTNRGRKTQRMRENKNCCFVLFRSYPTHNRKFQKNRKKIQKIKKHHYGFLSVQNTLEKAKKERKWKLLFRSVPTWPIIENSKKIATKFVKVINTHMASIEAKISLKGWEREKIKIIVPFRFYPTPNRKFQKNSK